MKGGRRCRTSALLLQLLLLAACGPPGRSTDQAGPWTRHTIDNAEKGADGVRIDDVNGDGLPDIATGWEEQGVTRAYLHPGYAAVKDPWPSVTVGRTPNVEDAVWADIDGDGAVDVVSSSEGRTQAVFVSFAPSDPARFLDPSAWTTAPIPATIGRKWMYAVPLDVDGKRGIDIVVGAKLDFAIVAWLESPEDPRDLGAWTLHEIGPAGWTMSIDALDMNDDGLVDLLVSDHSRSPVHGVRWLEHPRNAAELGNPWPSHYIGARSRSPVFIAPVEGGDGRVASVLVPSGARRLTLFEREDAQALEWKEDDLPYPSGVGEPKSAAVGDIDLDGKLDVVVACTNLSGDEQGIFWISNATDPAEVQQGSNELSGAQGEKFDRVELLDLDGDGDLDVLTTEERENFGVIWYENPLR